MTFIKQTLKNTASLMLAVGIIGSAYAAISTVSSGDPLTADSWNQIVNKINNTDTNSDDLTTKSYVDSTVSANSGGYPLTKGISQRSPSVNFKNSLTYCDDLNEGGFDDWRIPDMNELLIYSNSLSENYYLITKTFSQGYVAVFRPYDKSLGSVPTNNNYYTRCVR